MTRSCSRDRHEHVKQLLMMDGFKNQDSSVHELLEIRSQLKIILQHTGKDMPGIEKRSQLQGRSNTLMLNSALSK